MKDGTLKQLKQLKQSVWANQHKFVEFQTTGVLSIQASYATRKEQGQGGLVLKYIFTKIYWKSTMKRKQLFSLDKINKSFYISKKINLKHLLHESLSLFQDSNLVETDKWTIVAAVQSNYCCKSKFSNRFLIVHHCLNFAFMFYGIFNGG